MSKYLLLVFPLILLSGCITKSINREQFPIPKSVQQLEHWELDARIAMKNGKEGFSAGLRWLEAPHTYSFELTGPLGETRARLNGSHAMATLELPNEPMMTGPSTEALLADHFGWAVPITSLKLWVKGVPGDDSVDIQFDQSGKLTQFISNGWHVKYLAWQEVHGLSLPKRLEATNNGLHIKLALHEWTF